LPQEGGGGFPLIAATHSRRTGHLCQRRIPQGYPEVSKNNTIFASIKENGVFMADNESTAIHPDVAPAENEVVIVKRRVGAFSFTELEMILRAQGIENLILTGVTTSRVVLSTVGQAFDLDYRLIVVNDYCADPDPDTNMFLLKKFYLNMLLLPVPLKYQNLGIKL
jgi:nicotinamidase-related amidase